LLTEENIGYCEKSKDIAETRYRAIVREMNKIVNKKTSKFTTDALAVMQARVGKPVKVEIG
jgi:predicted XRE-type DNA-binding protein